MVSRLSKEVTTSAEGGGVQYGGNAKDPLFVITMSKGMCHCLRIEQVCTTLR